MHEIYFYVQMKNKKRVWRNPSSEALQLTSIALYTYDVSQNTRTILLGIEIMISCFRMHEMIFNTLIALSVNTEHFQNVPYL